MKSLNLLKKSKNRSFISGFIGSFLSATGVLATAVTVLGSSVYAETVLKEFTSNDTLSIPDNAQAGSFEILVVGGGGGGGNRIGGGGGAGYYVYITGTTLSPGNYTIEVGAGGSAGTGTVATQGGDGKSSGIKNSSSTYLVNCPGGGGGGATALTGRSGASGGGGGGYPNNQGTVDGGNASASPVVSLTGTIVKGGNKGGSGNRPSDVKVGYGGGGGGAKTAGANAGSAIGAGGDGYENTITGTKKTYAKGGAGGTNANNNTTPGSSGDTNTGSGGGGGGGGANGGAGADGIVVVKYTTGSTPTPPPTGDLYTWNAGTQANKWGDAGNWTPNWGTKKNSDIAVYPMTGDAVTYVDNTHTFNVLTNGAAGSTVVIYGNEGSTADKLIGSRFFGVRNSTTIFSNGVQVAFHGNIPNTAGEGINPNNDSFLADGASIIVKGQGTEVVIAGGNPPDNGSKSGASNIYAPNTYVLKGNNQKLEVLDGGLLVLSNMNYASSWQTAQEDNSVISQPYYTTTGHFAYQDLKNLTHHVSGLGSKMIIQWQLDDHTYGRPAGENISFIVENKGEMEFLMDPITSAGGAYAFNVGGMTIMKMVIDDATVTVHGYAQLSPSEEFLDSTENYHEIVFKGENPQLIFDSNRSTEEYNGQPDFGIRMGRNNTPTVSRLRFEVEPLWGAGPRIISNSKNQAGQGSWFQMGSYGEIEVDLTKLKEYESLSAVATAMDLSMVNGKLFIPIIQHEGNEHKSFIISTTDPEFIYPDNATWSAKLAHGTSPNDATEYNRSSEYNTAGMFYIMLENDPKAIELVMDDKERPYRGQLMSYKNYLNGIEMLDNQYFNDTIHVRLRSSSEGEYLDPNTYSLTIEHPEAGKTISDQQYIDAGYLNVRVTVNSGVAEGKTAVGRFTITTAILGIVAESFVVKPGDPEPEYTLSYSYSNALDSAGVLNTFTNNVRNPRNGLREGSTETHVEREGNILMPKYSTILNYDVVPYPGLIMEGGYSIYYWSQDGRKGPVIAIERGWWEAAYPECFNAMGQVLNDTGDGYVDYTDGLYYESLQKAFMTTNQWGVAGWEAYILGFTAQQVKTACIATSVSSAPNGGLRIELMNMPQLREKTGAMDLADHHHTTYTLTEASKGSQSYTEVSGQGNKDSSTFNQPLPSVDNPKRYRVQINYNYN